MHMNKFLFHSIIVAGCLAGTAGRAATVYNLSGDSQVIEVKTSEGFQPVTIENNRSYHAMGKLTMRYNWQEYTIAVNEDYAIWPDGVFGPQFRRNVYDGHHAF